MVLRTNFSLNWGHKAHFCWFIYAHLIVLSDICRNHHSAYRISTATHRKGLDLVIFTDKDIHNDACAVKCHRYVCNASEHGHVTVVRATVSVAYIIIKSCAAVCVCVLHTHVCKDVMWNHWNVWDGIYIGMYECKICVACME